MTFTQKEASLLKDQRKDEELCVKKYTEYATKANDPNLQQLFTYLASKEQEHYDTLTQLMNGIIPPLPKAGQPLTPEQEQMKQKDQQITDMTKQQGQFNQEDSDLCSDRLNVEKYVSSFYNSSIFEFTDEQVRNVLNHLQKEEQEHGEKLYNYMHAHNMYDPQM